MVAGEAVDHRDESRLHLMDERCFVGALTQTEEHRQSLFRARGGSLAGGAENQLAQPSTDGFRVVTRADSCDVADDRRRRGERCRVRLGARLPAQDHDGRADARRELFRQTGLADPSLAHDSDQDGASRGAREAQALAQDRLLACPTDKWDRPASRPRRDLLDRIRIERHIEALGPDPPATPVRHVRGRQLLRRCADEDLIDLRRRLQTRRGVDHRSGDQQLASRGAADGRLPGLDSDSHLERAIEPKLVAESPHPLPDR